MRRILKRILKITGISILVIVLGLIYVDINYMRIGPGEKLYCYIFPFLTPDESSAFDLPIGEFIGSKEEIEKVRDANLNYHTALLISNRDNNPDIIWPFVVNIPESNSIDPNEEPDYIKEELLKEHLWDGKSKINFWAVIKVGAHIEEKVNEANKSLSKTIKEHPELFKDAVEKIKRLKPEEVDATDAFNKTKELLNSTITNENEKEIIENLLLIRRIRGIVPTSEAGLENHITEALKQVTNNEGFKQLKEELKKDFGDADIIIGIKVEGDRAILVFGIPDAYYTEIRKFVKVGDTYKLYTSEKPKYSKALYRALAKYWKEKKLKSNP